MTNEAGQTALAMIPPVNSAGYQYQINDYGIPGRMYGRAQLPTHPLNENSGQAAVADLLRQHGAKK